MEMSSEVSDNDLMSGVLDEIALEGLDGITLASLWIRLRVRFAANAHPLDFNHQSVQTFIFNHLVKCLATERTVSMYLLPENRPTIQLYDRYEYVNEETGTLIEHSELIPTDIYGPVVPVGDQQVSGSSATYNERKNITKDVLSNDMTIEGIDKCFGLEKFVLVANQLRRSMALMGPYCEPDIDLTPIQYCILERIGRQRFLGEITIGKESGEYKQTPKTLFYYRKALLSKKLVKKKQCIVYNNKTIQNCHGLVLTLNRFQSQRLTVSEINAKKINDLLLESENNELDYEDVKTRLEMKTKHFRELLANYSVNFKIIELPKIAKNPIHRIIRLLKPISDDIEEPEDIEDDDDEEVAINGNKRNSLLSVFNAGKILADRPLLFQALAVIESHESQEGVSLKEVGRCLSLPRLESRSLVRYLEKVGAISTVMVDRGRQKVTLFVPKWRSTDTNAGMAVGRRTPVLNESALMTTNLVKRSNLILDYVRREELVERVFALKQLVRDSEKSSSYKVCSKSIIRIVHKLAADGLLRSIRTILRYQDRVKKLHFVCIPSITPDHPMVREKINQIKFQWIGKYCIDIHSDRNQVPQSVPQRPTNNIVVNLVYQPSIARKYGLEPKMKKILTLYRFLFYLTYDFTKDDIPDTDWRFNIEPLPEGHKTKVCTIGEIIPRLPLSIFVKVVWISYIIPGLSELLDDPVNKNLTLSQISPNIRQCLVYKRKFAANICEALVGLTYMGLVDTQHKEQTEKETTVITMKNKFSLIANNIQSDFEFNTMKDFDAFEEALKMHCFEPCNDCSIDKRLFVHNLRNWTYTPSYKSKTNLASNRLQKLSGTTDSVDNNVNKENNNKKKKRKKSTNQTTKSPKKQRTSESSAVNVAIPPVPTEIPAPTKPQTKVKQRMRNYDKIDLRAKSFLKKQRTDWTPEEDSFLLVCKVVSALLDPHCTHYICVNRNVIRDELHKYYPEVSKDKTALACQRRINYMLKNPNTRQNVSDYIGEYRQLLNVIRPDVPKTAEEVWSEAYVQLLHQTLSRMQSSLINSADTRIATIVIKSMEDLLSRFNVVSPPTNLLPVRGPLHEEPHNVVDIHVNVVTNVLLSSLLSKHCLSPHNTNNPKTDNKQFSQTLFRIYQRYPDSLIRSVVTKISKYGVMTKMKKINLSSIRNKGTTPYRISQNFLFLMQTKYHLENLLAEQTLSDDLFCIKNGKTGFEAAVVTSLLASKTIRFYTHIPDNIVLLEQDCPLFKSPSNALKNPRDPKSTSRYALHILRQHITNSIADRTKHSADYLYVNQCRITAHATDPLPLNVDEFENIFRIQKHIFSENFKARPIGRLSADDKKIIECIKSKRELGASEEDLRRICSPEAIEKSLKRFTEQKYLFRVGIRTFRWVCFEFVNPWLIRSQNTPDSGEKASNNVKNVQFFARYWKQPDGKLDLKVVFKLLSAVLGHIMTNPCIPKEKLIEIFNQSLQPIQLLELIELLKVIHCLQVIESPKISKPKLFESKIKFSDEKTVHYISTPDSIIRLHRLKQYFQIN